MLDNNLKLSVQRTVTAVEKSRQNKEKVPHKNLLLSRQWNKIWYSSARIFKLWLCDSLKCTKHEFKPIVFRMPARLHLSNQHTRKYIIIHTYTHRERKKDGKKRAFVIDDLMWSPKSNFPILITKCNDKELKWQLICGQAMCVCARARSVCWCIYFCSVRFASV